MYLHIIYRCYEHLWCFLRWVSVPAGRDAQRNCPWWIFHCFCLQQSIWWNNSPILWMETFNWCVSCQSFMLLFAMHIASREHKRVCIRWIILRVKESGERERERVVLWGTFNGLWRVSLQKAVFMFMIICCYWWLLFLCRGPNGVFLGVSHRGHRLVGGCVRPYHHSQLAGTLHLPGVRWGPPGRYWLYQSPPP